jgi:hypothetical protein
MKKILLTLLLFCLSIGYSQNQVAKDVQDLQRQNVTFLVKNVLTSFENTNTVEIDKVVDNATFAKINSSVVNEIYNNKNEYLEVTIPYNNQLITIDLYKVNLFAEGFHVDTDKNTNIPYQQGVYYRGIVKDDYTSVVSFNIFNNELNGIISANNIGNVVVGKLDIPNNTSDYIIYSDANMKIQNPFNCSFKDDDAATMNLNSANRDINTTRCATMYFEIDYNLYQNNNNNTTTTTNWLTSVFNNVQTLYSNDNITVSLKSMFIWTTQDPYNGIGNSSSDYLYKFNEIRPVFDGDVGQLVGIDPGGLGGVAVGINGVCTQSNFSYSDVNFAYSSVPTYSWTVEVISHEFGHLLGSRHTHGCWWNGNNTAIDGCGQQAGYQEGSCGQGPIPSNSVKGTIMSYCHLVNGVGISFNNGFGPQPRTAIQNAIDSGLCLSTDCTTTCINTVFNVQITAITTTSVSFTWSDNSSTSWQVSAFPFGSNPTTWQNATTNSFTINGLNPDTYYVIRVRRTCSAGLESNGSQSIFVTGANFCSGTTLTDSGGISNEYSDDETVIRILIPNLPNNKITLTFTQFDLELDYDYLYVYDGNSVNATLLNPGGSTGTNIPGPFTSTAADGSLTIKFYSDGGVTAPGYVANTSCTPTLANALFNGIDFSYFPNPTNGKVSIVSKNEINEVSVYSISGQLLIENKLNDLNTSVDISSFATGTYFFKLKFGEKEVNFKVLKM